MNSNPFTDKNNAPTIRAVFKVIGKKKEFWKDLMQFIKKNYEGFFTNFRKPYRFIFTSGSTGTPIKIVVSQKMMLQKRVSHLKMLNWYGLKREDAEISIGGTKIDLKTKVYYYFKNKRFLTSEHLDENRALKYIQIINHERPKILKKDRVLEAR